MATQNIYALTDTWNNVATTFKGIGLSVTDTASAAGSMLIDLQVGGASQFKVTKAGAATITTIELGNASDTTLARSSAGVVTIEGVEVTTNTATQTLSNKTLSSPTVSGTIAGAATWSGAQTFSANPTLWSSTGPELNWTETDGSANAKRWKMAIGGDVMYWATSNDANTTFNTWLQVSRSADTVSDINFGAGVTIGGPTGGNKGAGTLNCTGAYDDNVLLTDLVLDYAVTNTFDAVKYAHHPLRDQVAPWWFDPDQYAEFWKTERRLPGMLTWDDPADKPSTGESITRLTAVVEMQAALIENLNRRLKELEK